MISTSLPPYRGQGTKTIFWILTKTRIPGFLSKHRKASVHLHPKGAFL